MSTARSTTGSGPDRPLIRLYEPPSSDFGDDGPTLRQIFDTFLSSEIPPASAGDCERYLGYWDTFTACADGRGSRTAGPCADGPVRIADISTATVTAFRDWIVAEKSAGGLELSNSTANKAIKLVRRIIATAGDEGYRVRAIRTKCFPTQARPKYYLDELQIACLWSACDAMDWPPREPVRSYEGSPVRPSVFWRSVLICLRAYGMRVQDLVAYQGDKRGLRWGDISFDPRTPDPDGRAEYPGGWLSFTPAKTRRTGRTVYLPMVPAVRAAIDRLASATAERLGCDPRSLPAERPVFTCPKSRSLNAHWRLLQAAARVATPSGGPYQLEDFRKTAATYLSEAHADLPYLVCGWSTARSAVASKHYIAGERTIVEHLPRAPLPGCFADWLDEPSAAAQSNSGSSPD